MPVTVPSGSPAGSTTAGAIGWLLGWNGLQNLNFGILQAVLCMSCPWDCVSMPLKLVLLELYLGTLFQFSDHHYILKCGHTLFRFPDWWLTATMQIYIYFQHKTGHGYFD